MGERVNMESPRGLELQQFSPNRGLRFYNDHHVNHCFASNIRGSINLFSFELSAVVLFECVRPEPPH